MKSNTVSPSRIISISLKLLGGVLSIFVLIGITFLVLRFKTYDDPIPGKLSREQVNTSKNIVNDVTELNPIQTKGIVVAHTKEDIINAVKNNDHISIGGGRNSMGGQTASTRAVQIDMREYNKILSFSTTTKEITVQSGIRWRDIQDYIDPYNLSVKVMQTYSNFTVGGSLSVNVHGRYIGLGPIILSVKSFRIILADGSFVEASPNKNQDIFYSAIGGMGGIGVITDVTLSLDTNVNVERSRSIIMSKDYLSFFSEYIRDNKKVIFHNGDIYPPNFDTVSAVSWMVTDKAYTTEDRLIPRRIDYWKERIAWIVMSEWPKGRWIRQYIIDPLVYGGTPPVHTRNYEASYDVAELEPASRTKSTYVLQEYFIPVENFDAWVPIMKKIFNDNDVNVINVSIRHSLPDSGAKLAWADKEVFAFVVYYKQGTDEKAKDEVTKWTRQMIDAAISVGGTYYLPYQLLATNEQIHKAYPRLDEYFAIKKKYDPTNKFTNALWDKYYVATSTPISTSSTYKRAFPITFTSLPEWYIVYSADEYARVLKDGMPSSFPYFASNKQYWSQYKDVLSQVGEYKETTEVKDYIVVLKVIGVSYSAENFVKGIYENTVGKVSERFANSVQTPEDKFAYQVASDYATFIYDYPWYDFPYFSYLKTLWTLDADETCCTIGQDIRRLERKLFLTFELEVKTIYASAIKYATHQKFGVQDDIVCATVSYTKDAATSLLCAPHYQPFTRKLIETLDKELNNPYFFIHDIAGNKKIALTYREKEEDRSGYENIIELFRYKEIQSITDKDITYKDRVTSLVPVEYLPLLYQTLSFRGITIDHFYDY